MTFVLLALALTGAPDLPTRFARDVCPDKHKPDDSNVDTKRKLEDQVACTRKAMNKELDRVILPLKAKDATRYHAWMTLQAEDNAWREAVCTLAEELFWIDLETGLRSDGTARSTTRMACLIALHAHRGAFARALASKEHSAWQRYIESQREGGPPALAELEQLLAAAHRFQSVDAGPPARDSLEVPLTASEWTDLAALASQVKEGPAHLAAAQCALLPDWKDCASHLEPAWMGLSRPSRYGGGDP
jgi:hypothetical protein